MRNSAIIIFLAATTSSAQLPSNYQLPADWLLDSSPFKAGITQDKASGTVTFGNGLFSRTIDTRLGTTGRYINLMTGKSFESFRVFELVHDSTDRERRGLALRRLYRTVAPWVTENPLMLHVNPQLKETALLSVYNPTGKELTKAIAVPLYYSGLRNAVMVSKNGEKQTKGK